MKPSPSYACLFNSANDMQSNYIGLSPPQLQQLCYQLNHTCIPILLPHMGMELCDLRLDLILQC